MLQRIRHHRQLGSVVFTVFVFAWVVALWANVQVRQALPGTDLAYLDICFSGPGGAPTPDAAPAAHDSHHADPGCLLCIALATPPALTLAALRPPAPRVHPTSLSRAPAVAAWRAQAPLPARGPPPLPA
ncbi:hypothetical protein [Diaphorobacter sp.]|uniref:hypothetical protein n=1 Tax=Diaphorobacter sp. TaxID=1934310 RepID=UPI003D0FBC7D